MEIDLYELPIKAGLVYADLLILEGERFAGHWLDMGDLPEVGYLKSVKNETDGLVIKIKRMEETKVVVAVELKFEKIVPGVGL